MRELDMHFEGIWAFIVAFIMTLISLSIDKRFQIAVKRDKIGYGEYDLSSPVIRRELHSEAWRVIFFGAIIALGVELILSIHSSQSRYLVVLLLVSLLFYNFVSVIFNQASEEVFNAAAKVVAKCPNTENARQKLFHCYALSMDYKKETIELVELETTYAEQNKTRKSWIENGSRKLSSAILKLRGKSLEHWSNFSSCLGSSKNLAETQSDQFDSVKHARHDVAEQIQLVLDTNPRGYPNIERLIKKREHLSIGVWIMILISTILISIMDAKDSHNGEQSGQITMQPKSSSEIRGSTAKAPIQHEELLLR